MEPSWRIIITGLKPTDESHGSTKVMHHLPPAYLSLLAPPRQLALCSLIVSVLSCTAARQLPHVDNLVLIDKTERFNSALVGQYKDVKQPPCRCSEAEGTT